MAQTETAQGHNATFSCGCNGPTRVITAGRVEHACASKYANATSFYDGVDRFLQWERAEINRELTNGQLRYNWMAVWS